MPWRAAVTLPFSRIEIVARIPSCSGVYAIIEDGGCRFIAGTWNLKARLLELASVLEDSTGALCIRFELCAEAELSARAEELRAEFLKPDPTLPAKRLPGLSLLEDQVRGSA